jgi:preprotein translocase subunit SecG
MRYNELLAEKVIVVVMTIIAISALYFIIRILLNRHKGNDELDGLL